MKRFDLICILILCTMLYASPPILSNYKTRLCSTYSTIGRCQYEECCTYAHGVDELRRRSTLNPQEASIMQSKTVKDHEGRIVELETDLERVWQHVLRLEQDLFKINNQYLLSRGDQMVVQSLPPH